MSEFNKETSGSELSSGAESESKESGASSAANDSAAKHIEKLLKEKQNYAKGFSELKDQYEKLMEEKKAREEQELIAKQQHTKVIELQKKEIDELKNQLGTYHNRELEGKKSLAIISELKKLGFVDNDSNREIALKLFDKKEVEIDPTSNLVLGADIAAKAFYNRFNSLGIFGKKPIGTNQNSVNYTNAPSEKSISDMNSMEREAKLKEALGNILKAEKQAS